MNLGTLLSRHAQYQPDKLALIIDDHRLTFKEYNQKRQSPGKCPAGDGYSKRRQDRHATSQLHGVAGNLLGCVQDRRRGGALEHPASRERSQGAAGRF